MSSDTPVVFLSAKGEIRQGKLKATTPAALATAFKKKEPPQNVGKYTWGKKTLFIFAYLEGKSGTENQHHLPPPLEGMTFFGDILVIASNSPSSYTPPTALNTADYESFYTQKLEGEDEDDLYKSEEDEEAPVADVDIPEEEDEDDEGGVPEGDEEEEEEGGGAGDEGDGEEEEDVIPVARIPKAKKVTARKAAVANPNLTALQDPELSPDAPAAGVPIRERVLEVIRGTFDHLEEDAADSFEALLYRTALETAVKEDIHSSWNLVAFCDVYLAIARRIIGNLNASSYVGNKNLMARWKDGELTLEQIIRQTYYELAPDLWQTMVDRRAKQEKIMLEGDFSRATDRWQCNSCKMRKCTFYELQTRSADEPMTLFIHCLNCGKRWTQ